MLMMNLCCRGKQNQRMCPYFSMYKIHFHCQPLYYVICFLHYNKYNLIMDTNTLSPLLHVWFLQRRQKVHYSLFIFWDLGGTVFQGILQNNCTNTHTKSHYQYFFLYYITKILLPHLELSIVISKNYYLKLFIIFKVQDK